MPETKVIWIPDKTLSPAERRRLLRILFGPQGHRRNAKRTDEASCRGATMGFDKDAPAAAGTAPGLAD